jgi:phage baseplate assembly protein W
MATIFKGFSTVDKIRAPYSLNDMELVKRDLLNEFYTRKGERVMRPNFGSIIHDLLMNPEDMFSVNEIEEDIKRIIDKEQRVELLDIDVYMTDHTVRADVHLKYIILESEDVLYLEFTREN